MEGPLSCILPGNPGQSRWDSGVHRELPGDIRDFLVRELEDGKTIQKGRFFMSTLMTIKGLSEKISARYHLPKAEVMSYIERHAGLKAVAFALNCDYCCIRAIAERVGDKVGVKID